MAIFGQFDSRRAGAARPIGLRAEAEAYAASLGLTRGTPDWGDAVRHFVLNLSAEDRRDTSASAWAHEGARYSRGPAVEMASRPNRSPPPTPRAPPPQVSDRDNQAAQSLLPPSQRGLPPRDPSLGGLFRESRQSVLEGSGALPGRRNAVQRGDKKPSVDAQYSAILANEGGLNPDGSFRTSEAGAIGPAQIVPNTAPEAAKRAFLPFDGQLFRTDRGYNEALGRAYYNSLLKEFGDPAKAAAAYNRGPTKFRSILREAQRAGEPDNWEAYLPKETRDYVRAFRMRLGLPDEDLTVPPR